MVGEAARRIALTDPLVAGQIAGLPRIISIRNVIAHDYDEIDHALVIEIVRAHLPALPPIWLTFWAVRRPNK